MNRPNGKIPSVFDIKLFRPHKDQPWKSKSGGALRVGFAWPIDLILGGFFLYDQAELNKLPADIRGARLYRVSDIPAGKIGGTEFHRVRQEFVGVTRGEVEWVCEDLNGGKKTFTLNPDLGLSIWMPAFMLHTYRVLSPGSEISVFVNTLFPPDKPELHDTYSEQAFRALQAEYAASTLK